MLISKFDLYKPEWLELVFENRNKGYGAYELRQHYARNMVRAMGLTFLAVLLLSGATIVFHGAPAAIPIHPTDPVIQVTLTPQIAQPKPRHTELPKPLNVQHHAAASTTQHIPPIVVPDPQARGQMKRNIAITVDVGPIDSKGGPGGTNIPTVTTNTGPAGPPVDETVHQPTFLDVMPEPYGGEGAWAKFLSKNLRYPPPAQEEGLSGRVVLSFIIEKNGTLSDITVISAAGHGFDEEALRVLKLAKAWKPGMQNGQPVRVRYMIPINFQVSE